MPDPLPDFDSLIPVDRYLAFWAWCRAWNARPQKRVKQHHPVNPYSVVRPVIEESEREWTTADYVAEAQRLEQERREEGMEDA